jgi:hypothetical protein
MTMFASQTSCWDMGYMGVASAGDPCDVLLQRVPHLVCCNDAFVETMLEQAGLEGVVLRFEVLRKGGEITGEVLVTLASSMAAQFAVQLLHGCCWGTKGVAPVKASLQPAGTQFQSAVRRASVGHGSESQGPNDQPVSLDQGATPRRRSLRRKGSNMSSDCERSTTAGSGSGSDDDAKTRTRLLLSPSLSPLSPSLSPSGRQLWADILSDDDE